MKALIIFIMSLISLGINAQTASYYGKGFHGKPTASGELFNKNAMTAAHKTLAFGTKVKVTNKENKKSVIVTINDRGPFVKGRVLDLSEAAFAQIADKKVGVIHVIIEPIIEMVSLHKKHI